MWASIIRMLGPIAVERVVERVLGRREDQPRPPARPPTDAEERLSALQAQLDALRDVHAKQLVALSDVLRAVGTRATIAFWLSIASIVVALVALATVIAR
jgi:hypothetical protein